jgi:RIO kinase 1
LTHPGHAPPTATISSIKTPARLQSLQGEGLIDSMQRQLLSGKEAMVFVVPCGDETRCAKVYKEANNRSFRQAQAAA